MTPAIPPRSGAPVRPPRNSPMARKIAIPCNTPYSIRWRTRQLAQTKSPSVLSAASSKAPASADTNVRPPSDAVIRFPVSVRQILRLRLRQPEAGDDADDVGRGADDRCGVGQLDGDRRAGHRGDERRRDVGRVGA